MAKLLKCKKCKRYTLQSACPNCNSTTSPAHPPRYSKEDKYAFYRRKELFDLEASLN